MIDHQGYERVQVIRNGPETSLYRGTRKLDTKQIILKILNNDYPSPADLTKLNSLRSRMASDRSVKVCGLEPYRNGLMLVMDDPGGDLLESVMATEKKFSLKEFLTIAIRITESLEAFHQNEIIHRNLSPSCIMIDGKTGNACITDLENSVHVSENVDEEYCWNMSEKSLPYISPEQTGRMNRPVDYRTDMYSLGVIFYEMLLGRRPFHGCDDMEWVHCHIAKQPPIPHEIEPEVPEIVSKIIMKLMAKMAEERYQSAAGLIMDLQSCLYQLESTGTVSFFDIGRWDESTRFSFPSKLYGREREIEEIFNSFDRVRRGNRELVLIQGPPGIGKSSIAGEIYRRIVGQCSFFGSGRSDNLKHDTPYAPFMQVFQDFVRHILSAPERHLVDWKNKIQAALGNNGQIIVDIIPDLELIIERQSPAPDLPSAQSLNRFSMVFQKFFRSIISADQPFVIFLDDLQWIDAASLKLLELCMNDAMSGRLMIIGAYRDNEIGSNHPLNSTLRTIQNGNSIVTVLPIRSLELLDTVQLIAETMKCSMNEVKPLAEFCFQRTEGNPFFIKQFLYALYKDNLVEFDVDRCRWKWRIDEIRYHESTDHIVEFIMDKMRKLPGETQKIIQAASCIGREFDIGLIAAVSGMSCDVVSSCLRKAVSERLLVPVMTGDYMYDNTDLNSIVGLMRKDTVNTRHDIGKENNQLYRFVHDRVRQAASSLISDLQRKAIHLTIGRCIQSKYTDTDGSEKIFDIVKHLNLGSELVKNHKDKDLLIEMNLLAARRAKAAVAYGTAINYLKTSIDMLDEDSWERAYDLTLSLYVEAAEMAYLSCETDYMNVLVKEVLDRGKNLLDKVKAYEIQILSLNAGNRLTDAVKTMLRILRELGVFLPENPGRVSFAVGVLKLKMLMGRKQDEAILSLPKLTDPHKEAVMRIMVSGATAAHVAEPRLSLLMTIQALSLSMKYGNNAYLIYSFAACGLFFSGYLGSIESGYRMGNLALKLMDRYPMRSQKARTMFLVYCYIRHWKEHGRALIEPLLEIYNMGLETGEVEYSAFAISRYCTQPFFLGMELQKIKNTIDQYIPVLTQLGQAIATNWTLLQHQVVLNLVEGVALPTCLVGDSFDENAAVPLQIAANERLGLYQFYLNKMMLCFMFSDYREALEHGAVAEKYLDGVVGNPLVPLFYFYDSLIRLALYDPDLKGENRRTIKRRVAANQRKMKKWAFHAPMNYLHKWQLVEAERARIAGNRLDAMEAYRESLRLARENKYLNEEALANELCAKFYLSLNDEKVARLYMTDAYYCYLQWGAKAKIDDLERTFPALLSRLSKKESIENATDVMPMKREYGTDDLDLSTIMKAAQALSEEIVLDALLEKMMKIMIENAGAQRGVLILKDDILRIEAEGFIGEDRFTRLSSLPVSDCSELPTSIIYYVFRKAESVILDNASERHSFMDDPYFLKRKKKSILCEPVIHHGQPVGVLYLENDLITGAFTAERVELLRLLASQAAISLENAKLYSDVNKYSHELEEKVEERTKELRDTISEVDEAKKAAESANKAKSQFLANMTHEIRTPLSGIIGMTELAMEAGLDANQREIIGTIMNEANMLFDIVNDVLDFSKIEAGKLELENIPFNLGDVLDDVRCFLETSARQKGLRFRLEFLEEVSPYVIGDPGRLRQILWNLGGNAIKFTEQGEICISVEIVEDHRDSVKFQFVVKDTGIGISKEKQDAIFDSFNQLDGSTTRKYGGTGLGTTISKQLVELMGGEIGIDSQVGHGSTFWFTVVFAKQSDDTIGSEMGTMKTGKGHVVKEKRILLVEDYPTNQLVVMKPLQDAGYLVDLAENGYDAVQAYTNEQYDLIFMDIQMPIMDGYEATRQIRALEREKRKTDQMTVTERTPIIAMTAHAMKEDREKCLQVGMDDYIAKPIRQVNLFAILNKWGLAYEVCGKDSVHNGSKHSFEKQSEPIEYERAVHEFYGDRELLDEVISGFLKNAQSQIEIIKRALVTGDIETIKREAHSIKGGAANLTAKDLCDAASEIKAAIPLGMPGVMEELVNNLERELHRLELYIMDKRNER